MSFPLFTSLQPRTVESYWYSIDKHSKGDEVDIKKIEEEHKHWTNAINGRFIDESALGTPIESSTPEDEEEDDDDDEDEEGDETDESHDNDTEDVVFNNGPIINEMPINSQVNETVRARIGTSR